jgi:hypothetical protein
MAEAFGHVGKAYDFEFDFNVSTRLVCTELIYRCYHHRGSIAFPLTKRLGRYTLTGDDIATLVVDSLCRSRREEACPCVGGTSAPHSLLTSAPTASSSPAVIAEPAAPPGFSLEAVLLKIGDGEARFIAKADLLETMQRIQSGWRPAKMTEGAHA